MTARREWAALAGGVFGEDLFSGGDQLVEAADFEGGILQSL
jgi:hypothetical protein